MFSASGDHFEGKRVSERYRIKQVEKWTEHTVFCIAEDMANNQLFDLLLINPSVIKNASDLKKQIEKKMKLKHRNIARVLAFGSTTDGDEYIVSEKASKTSLADLFSRGAMPVRQACELVAQLIDGLEHFCKTGEQCLLPLPQRISVEASGVQTQLKISPLEFSENLLPAETCYQDNLTQIEKTRYAAPECLKGAKVDQRSQIYSLACLLFQMLSGQAPFDSDDLVELESQHLCVSPRRLFEVRSDLYVEPRIEAVLQKALQKEPEKRQTTLAEFKQELQDALSMPSFWNSRRRKLAGVSATLLAGFAAVYLSAQMGFGLNILSAIPEPGPVPIETDGPNTSEEPVSEEGKTGMLASLPNVPATAVQLGDLKLSGNESRVLSAGDYVCKSILLSGNAKLFNKGTVRLWVDAPNDGRMAVDLKEDAMLVSSRDPEEFTIYDLNSSDIKMRGKTKIKASFQAPAALLDASDDAQIEGSFISNGQKLDKNARFINSSSEE